MKFKKVMAAVLCGALMFGIFGCDKIGNITQTESETETEDTTEKDTAEIKKTVAECVTALSNFDGKSVYALTDWEKDDDSYKELASLLDIDSHAKKKGNDLAECYKFIASTLTCSADTGVIDFDGDRATYRVQFKTMDWKAVYTGLYGQYHSYAEVLADLKLKKVEYNSPLYRDDGGAAPGGNARLGTPSRPQVWQDAPLRLAPRLTSSPGHPQTPLGSRSRSVPPTAAFRGNF